MTLTAWKILRRNNEQKGSCAKRLAYAVSAAALLVALGASTVEASTELGLHVELHFAANCPPVDGYRHSGAPPVPSNPYSPDLLWPVSWGPERPIVVEEGGPFNGSDPGDSFVFTLVGPDQRTVLFSEPIDLKYEFDKSNPYYELIARVDCSSVPYTEVTDPNTAMPGNAPRPWLPIGGVLLATAVGIGWRTLRRSRAGASRSG